MDLTRGFEEVSVVPCGVQKGRDRFPELSKRPRHCPWRCNLTGLSRTYNLYFVAYVDQIYVYQPQFPSQRLPERPDLILKLPVSRSGLVGFLSANEPHGVNNMVLEDLGNEEILACACDDGDVIAYYTKHIDDVVRRRNAPNIVEEVTGDDVGPFFVQNVKSSAWGLAVHKEARILAVSANTHNVTVFKFALVDKKELDPDKSDLDESDEKRVNDRTNEHRCELSGHTHNIPCVAFCNTPEDPTGRWLMSVDISGVIVLWDLDTEGAVVRSFPCEDHVSHEYAWGLLCLDKRSFRQTFSLDEAFGARPEHNFYDMGPTGYGRYQPHFDISRSIANVRDSSPWSWHFKSGWQHEPLGHQEWMSHGDMLLAPSATGDSEDGGSADDAVDDDADSDSDYPGLLDPPTVIPAVSGFPTFQTIVPRLSHKVANSEASVGPKPTLPDFPFIHTTALNAFLAAAIRANEARTVINDPLAQKLPSSIGSLYHFRRMNMFAQIPEIGVVVIASQVGRVAVFTLTRPPNINVFAPYAPEADPTLPRPRLPKFAMRLDWILPFRSQEREGYRPEAPLLGIAVGVVQGTENMGPGEKRWRLMITYVDNTVLSYEIGGPRRGTPDVVV